MLIPPKASDKCQLPQLLRIEVKGHDGCNSPMGPNQPQNTKEIKVPVIQDARKPASDLRRANGRGSRRPGMYRDSKACGNGLVYRPYIRPNVEAVVSHHDNLEVGELR